MVDNLGICSRYDPQRANDLVDVNCVCSIDCTVGEAWRRCGRLRGVSAEVVCCRAHVSTALLSPELHERVHGTNLRHV